MLSFLSVIRAPLAAALIALTVFLAAGIRSALAQGAGDLIVTPTRVVLEGRERAAQVTLANRGSAAATFRISLIAMSMDENGEMTEIEPGTGGVLTAEKLVRYAPRQIEIAPGGTQVVRLSIRKPAGLEEGEYRSHMFFRAVPDESAGRSVTQESDLPDDALSIQLVPIYGITIPVIVRHGDIAGQAGLSDVAVQPAAGDAPARISLNLTREGDRSAFGDLRATYVPSGGGDELVVAEISRVAIYTPNDKRRVVMPIRASGA